MRECNTLIMLVFMFRGSIASVRRSAQRGFKGCAFLSRNWQSNCSISLAALKPS